MANKEDENIDNKQEEKNAFPPGKGKLNPDTVVGNPDMQYSGRSTDYRNIRNTGHSVGGGASQSRDGENGNYFNPDDEKNFNRSNQAMEDKNEHSAGSRNIHDARPSSKYGGTPGKTMVKNTGLNEYHDHEAESKLQGQQQGGSHGGGAAANKKFGNQADTNAQRAKKQSSDGDYKGHK